MIHKLSITNFRGIQSVELEDMGRICLISGKNNVGKSSLLEAVFLLMDHISTDSFSKVNGFRGALSGDAAAMWEPFFYNMDLSRQIRIAMTEDDIVSSLTYERDTAYLPMSDNNFPEDVLAQFRTATRGAYSLRFDYASDGYRESGHFFVASNGVLRQMATSLPGNEIRLMRRTRYLNASLSRSLESVADGIGKLELSGNKQLIIGVLRKVDPAIEDIVTVSQQGITQLHVRAHDKWIPIQFAGDGILRLLQICLALLENTDGLVLIDEIESGLHYSAYASLWRAIEDLSSQTGCQVIATTHSYEMIAAVQGSIDDTSSFAYYRIGKSANDVVAHRFSHSMLSSALDSELEVR